MQSGGQWKETTGSIQETAANLVGAKETARDGMFSCKFVGEFSVVCGLWLML